MSRLFPSSRYVKARQGDGISSGPVFVGSLLAVFHALSSCVFLPMLAINLLGCSLWRQGCCPHLGYDPQGPPVRGKIWQESLFNNTPRFLSLWVPTLLPRLPASSTAKPLSVCQEGNEFWNIPCYRHVLPDMTLVGTRNPEHGELFCELFRVPYFRVRALQHLPPQLPLFSLLSPLPLVMLPELSSAEPSRTSSLSVLASVTDWGESCSLLNITSGFILHVHIRSPNDGCDYSGLETTPRPPSCVKVLMRSSASASTTLQVSRSPLSSRYGFASFGQLTYFLVLRCGRSDYDLLWRT